MSQSTPTADTAFSFGTLARHRWPTLVAVGLTAALWLGGLVDDAAQGLGFAALIYLIFGAVRGHLKPARWLALESAGLVAFGGLTAIALAVDPGVGKYLLAAGWLGHAAWDVFHYRADRVAPRWYAELCFVCDVMWAVLVVVLPFG